MPTFLMLIYEGNYVGRGYLNRHATIFTYKNGVYVTFGGEGVFELSSARSMFD